MIGDAAEDVAQPGLRVEAIELGRLDQRVDCGSPLATAVGAGKEKFFLPTATPRSARSVGLLSISRRCL